MKKEQTTHYMKLWDDPFQLIKNKTKTIEMRLNDEKRSLIKLNDYIIFTNNKTQEQLKTKVIHIYKYETFQELYKHHDQISIGYKENETARPEDMNLYYSSEDIKHYGVLGIQIEVID